MCSRGERSADDARGNQACAQEESDLQRMQGVTKRVLKKRAICR